MDNINNQSNNNLNDELFKDIDKSEIPWMIIGSYFKNNHLQQLIKHQIESYNNFIELEINKTVEMFNPLVICSENDYIKEHDLYRLKIEINFKNLSLFRPQIYENNGATKILFPQEARTRNFTYSSALTLDLDIDYIVTNGVDYKNVVKYKKMLKNINFGRIPVMLKSNICVLSQYKQLSTDETYECYMDPGGYFIINGSEKTVLGQERASENKIYCFNISKNSTKWSWIAEIKCVPDWKCISPKQINIMIATKNNGFGNAIYLQIPRLKNPIPLFIIFRAFNVIGDKDICEKILINIDDKIIEKNKERKKLLYCLKASIVDANTCLTHEDAMKYILTSVIYNPINIDKEAGLKKKREYTMDVLDNDIFPNCKCNNKKIYMLGYMTNILLKTSCGLLPQSDRDSYTNKKIDLTGNLLNNLFRNYFNKLVKDMVKQVTKEINNGSWKSNENYENIINNTNIYKIVKSTTIENGIKRALATGDFGIKQLNTNKVGVAQVLNRLTYISSLSHLRRINTPIDKSGKLVPPRRLHNSSWGFLCPAETPEGASVGVVKNLSYLAHITIYSHSDALYEYVNKFIVDNKKINEVYYDVNNNYEDKVKVFINGIYQGISDNPIDLYYDLKDKKYRGILNIYTSIIFDTKLLEIRVCNEAGRLTRPLLKLKDRKPLYNKYILDKMKNNTLNFYDLLITINDNESIVEYVDSIEQEHILIAMNEDDLIKNKNYKYTHMEIHPSSIFGILASCIPFPENNQSPRNTYQSAMGKQAMGMYVTNFQSRMDKTAYVLTYPMRPLVDTRIMNIIKLNTIPSGCQVIVAIASYTGYNQEDSILFNKGSIDRGLFSATIYHTEKDEDKKLFGNEEIRCKPDNSKTKNMKFANYSKLNSNGVIEKDKLVEDRDVIIGKIAPIKENKNDFTKTIKFQDESRIYRTNEETYVDKNLINKNGDGYNFCKVRLRNYRKPNIGDKFCIKETALILTESGWISLKDIDINKHKVATLKNNKELDYVYAVEKYEFDCIDEELYYMKSQQVDMVCTKEHKLYVKKREHDNFEFIEAKNAFGKRIKYKKDALNTYSDIKNIVLDKKTYDMDGFLMLLGSFISDGWVETGKKYKRINLSMIKKRKRDYIKNVLDDLNIHYNFTKDRVLIGNTYNELIDYFKLLSVKASNKFLPDFVWKLSQRQSIILMNSLMQGDGSYNKQGSCGYYTSSVKLANQIQQLALHSGWSGTIKLYKNKEAGHISKINERVIKSNYNNYCIRIIKTKNNPEVNHGHTHEQTAQEEKYIKYTGKVGCIEVPDTHLFYYKEDIYSPPVWTGNSSRHKLGCAEKHSAQSIQALD